MTVIQSYEPKADETAAITPIEYGGLQAAYEHFNAELFDGTLPNVLITYQRRAHTYGYFHAGRFVGRDGQVHHGELALNPDGFIGRSDRDILATLVHEKVHICLEDEGDRPVPVQQRHGRRP